MTELLLLIIIVLLIYSIYNFQHQNNTDKNEEKQLPFQKLLPDYLNKTCEIRVKEALPEIDILYAVKGVLIDMDDAWIMIEIVKKKKITRKMLRIDNISSIKEILA